jgi:hypothetical protein
MKNIPLEVEIKLNGEIRKALMYKGTPMNKIPKSWGECKVVGHNIGNAYNPSYMDIYLNPKGSNYAKYSIYRDGCFHPYTGIIIFQ